MDIQAPQVLREPLRVPDKLLMGPGPSNCSPKVQLAMGLPTLGHMHPETLKIMDDIKEGIRYVFQTRNSLTLAVSASGHGGMEAVLCNLLEPGDVALIVKNGFWGQRAAAMAERYGARVVTLDVQAGESISPAEVAKAMAQHKPRILFATQGESSTGVLQKIEGLGPLCHKLGCLLVVDTVASVGGTPFLADAWEVDAVYTGSQKVLGAAAGMAPISFSERAKERIFSRKTPVKVFYWDMTVLGDYWGCFGRPRVYHHTISAQLLYGLREGLASIADEGLENVIKRHQECAQRLYEGLHRLGLELFVREQCKRLPTVTTVHVPNGVNWRDVLTYAMENYGLEISGGLGPTAARVFRIGVMGHNATPLKVDLLLKVLQEGLEFAHSRNSKL